MFRNAIKNQRIFSHLKFNRFLGRKTSSISNIFYDEKYSIPNENLDTGIFEIPNLYTPEDFKDFGSNYLNKARDLQSQCIPSQVNNATGFVRHHFDGFSSVDEHLLEGYEYMHQLNNDRNMFDILQKIQTIRTQDNGTFELDNEENVLISGLIRDLQISFSDNSEELMRLNCELDNLIEEFYSSQEYFKSNPEKTIDSITSILNTRHEIAQSLNMNSFAEYEFLRENIALEGANEVREFIEEFEFFNENFQTQQRSLFVRDENLGELKWTWDNVLGGLERISSEILGIRLQPCEISKYEQWGENVRKIRCYDSENDDFLGTIYVEFFSERNASSRSSFPKFGKKKIGQKPICIARINLRENIGKDVDEHGFQKLVLSNIRALFHEFGHCYHTILGASDYQFISGIRCSKDRLEIPSYFMEYLLQNYLLFSYFGDELTEDEFRYLIDSRYQYFHQSTKSLVANSKLNILLHSRSLDEFEEETRSIILDQYRNSQLASYLVNYGPSFFTYLFSSVVAAQAFYKGFRNYPDGDEINRKNLVKAVFCGGDRTSLDVVNSIAGDDIISPFYYFDLTNL